MGLFLNSGSGGGGTGISYSSQSTPFQLQSGTTYYWKVVANDEQGGATESEIHTFTTE
ncbi:MAG: hypothetical protein HY752_04060 [Nitrospirae bacterium]|nr:hypothetical protein [Nitrospirota bacterium]